MEHYPYDNNQAASGVSTNSGSRRKIKVILIATGVIVAIIIVWLYIMAQVDRPEEIPLGDNNPTAEEIEMLMRAGPPAGNVENPTPKELEKLYKAMSKQGQ